MSRQTKTKFYFFLFIIFSISNSSFLLLATKLLKFFSKPLNKILYFAVSLQLSQNNILLITESSESPELFQQLDVYGTPTTVILDQDGNELGRIDGYEPPEEYLRDLNEINGH